MYQKWTAFRLLSIGCLFFITCQSCISHKDLVALREEPNNPEYLPIDSSFNDFAVAPFSPYKIQPYDQLMIRINAYSGSTEDFINREFNSQNQGGGGGGGGNGQNFDPSTIYFSSYAVSDSGFIFLPVLGKIKVSDLTYLEVKMMLEEKLKPRLKLVTVSVKVANMRVTVLGEVETPGVFYLVNDKTTLLDAISMAGDITDFGNRRRVKLIRTGKERSKTVQINLNRSEFLSSQYFYVEPNDIIYIEPLKAKAADISGRTIGIVFSAISTAALIVNVITNLRQDPK